MSKDSPGKDLTPWYREVTAYQWLVLALASAGWVFDIYEGQIFIITRGQLLSEILGTGSESRDVKYYGEILNGFYLAGGALGGILFGSLADRWGRKPMLVATILIYSLFSGLTFFVGSLWELALLRFLVAVGTGGEWSVAAALVAEVFPGRCGPGPVRSSMQQASWAPGWPDWRDSRSGPTGGMATSWASFPRC